MLETNVFKEVAKILASSQIDNNNKIQKLENLINRIIAKNPIEDIEKLSLLIQEGINNSIVNDTELDGLKKQNDARFKMQQLVMDKFLKFIIQRLKTNDTATKELQDIINKFDETISLKRVDDFKGDIKDKDLGKLFYTFADRFIFFGDSPILELGTSNTSESGKNSMNNNTSIKLFHDTRFNEANFGTNIVVTAEDSHIIADEFRGIATKARLADIAEKYHVDKLYPNGTLCGINLKGDSEITIYVNENETPYVGIISTAPGFLLNSEKSDEDHQYIALKGRVPVRLTNHILKGDRLYPCIDDKGNATNATNIKKNTHINDMYVTPLYSIGLALKDSYEEDGIIYTEIFIR